MFTLTRGNTVQKTMKKKFGIKLKDAKKLGEGKYGEVYLVIDPQTQTKQAVKIVKKSKLRDWADKIFLQNEIKLHLSFDHPHIVKLFDAFEDKRSHYMLLELMDGGELFDRIVRDGSFSERKAALVIRNVAEALLYLHERNIVHRDLKPENLLLAHADDDINLKLADFGFACECAEPLYTPCGTLTYIAPEVLVSTPYKTEIDIWSLGVILYTILSGMPPFHGSTDQALIKTVVRGRFGFIGPAWEKISDEAKDLVSKMLVVNQTERITAEGVLNHPWVKDAEHTSDESLSIIAENMRLYKAKNLLRQAVKGVQIVERMREFAKTCNFDSDSEDEEDEEQN